VLSSIALPDQHDALQPQPQRALPNCGRGHTITKPRKTKVLGAMKKANKLGNIQLYISASLCQRNRLSRC